MSNEQVQQSAASTAASYLAFPVITTGAGAIGSIKRNHGIKQALSACRKSDFKKMQGVLDGDCFTKANALAENYDKYKDLSKKVSKLDKKVGKGKLSLTQRFFNLFRKQDKKVTFEDISKQFEDAKIAKSSAEATLSSGKLLVEEAAERGLKNNAKKFFKNEIKNPIVIAMTALEALPEITGKIVPTFKEKGFVEGLKQTGKSILKIGSNFLSYAAGSALGRLVGGAIGTIICPGAGSAVGAKVGDMLGSMLIGSNVTKVVNKVIGENESEANKQQTQIAQTTETQNQLQQRSMTDYNA